MMAPIIAWASSIKKLRKLTDSAGTISSSWAAISSKFRDGVMTFFLPKKTVITFSSEIVTQILP